MNRLDEIVLHGRPADRPIGLLAYERLRWAAIAAILILGLGIACLFWVLGTAVQQNDRDHDALEQRVAHLEQEIANLKE